MKFNPIKKMIKKTIRSIFKIFSCEKDGLFYDPILDSDFYRNGFGVQINSSACEDIDSIDLLCRLSPFVPHRKKEIDQALTKAINWVLCNQVGDGGFVFRLHEPFIYGHQQTSSQKNQGAMFPTWFRLLSLAYLTRYFGMSQFKITVAPGLEN
jgi:hypothetical protein